MRKTPDIGADTNPCAAVPVVDRVETDVATDVLEPLGRAIDSATRSPAAPGRDPFQGNPLNAATAPAPQGPRRRVWVASILLHAVAAVVLLLMPDRGALLDERQPIEISFYAPEALEPQALPEPEPVVEPEVAELPPEPEPIVEAAPTPVPEPIVETEPQPLPEPIVAETRLPEPVPAPVAEPIPEPAQPKREVQTNLLARTAPEPPPEPRKAPRQAQMAGFARAETVAREEPVAERQVARAGAFAAEAAPEPAEPVGTPDNRVVAAGNFADGPVTVPKAGAKQRARTVATASFADDATTPETTAPTRERRVAASNFGSDDAAPEATAAKTRGTVTSIGFDAVAAAPAAPKRQRLAEDLDTPVEILSKTNPDYTAEARELRIEGEVVLEVRFDASGVLHVLSVVSGLGHGLDQAAIKAAEAIEFKPARQDGRSVDYTATLRVVFRLA